MRTRSRCSAKNGADVNARSNPLTFPLREVRGRQVGPLHRAAARRLDAADVRGSPGRGGAPSARWPKRGADLNLTDPDGTSALVLAIINAHYDLAAMLLDKGANPNLGRLERAWRRCTRRST